MTRRWLPNALLRAASLLAPAEHRAEWLREWRSELWYIAPPARTRFCAGAFRDALWIRRRHHATSPLECLAVLAAVAVLSLGITILLPSPQTMGAPRLKLRDVPAACAAMCLLSALLLPATRIVLGPSPTPGHSLPWRTRLRNATFLALKIALVQPPMLCGFVLLIQALKILPIAPQLAVCGSWILGFRWVLEDQRRRCPVCLHRLTAFVRIGSPSATFLEWYGAESMCSRGHGLLQAPDLSASYCASSHWLRLDPSWTSLFASARGPRS